MSIPDLDILRNYTLTLDCGHKRRTAAPIAVGEQLPCLDKKHELEPHTVTKIEDLHGRSVERVGWMSPKASLHGAYSRHSRRAEELEAEAKTLRWWRFGKKAALRAQARKERSDAKMAGRILAAGIGFGRSRSRFF